MKALSLWQPWASLVADGTKRVETRSWRTSHRGPIAIHAAATRAGWEDLDEEVALLLGLKCVPPRRAPRPSDYAHGAVVAIADLVHCEVMDEGLLASEDRLERLVGDWRLGRFAWFLENVRPVQAPIPARGRQGLWEWKAPPADELERRQG